MSGTIVPERLIMDYWDRFLSELSDEFNVEITDYPLDDAEGYISFSNGSYNITVRCNHFPGCCGYAIFTDVTLNMDLDSYDIIVRLMEKMLDDYGYAGGFYVSLEDADYRVLNETFAKRSWDLEETVVNPHSGNTLKRWYYSV